MFSTLMEEVRNGADGCATMPQALAFADSPAELNARQNNRLHGGPRHRTCASYLDGLQELATSSLDVFKGTSFGEHEEMSQDFIQVAVGGASNGGG